MVEDVSRRQLAPGAPHAFIGGECAEPCDLRLRRRHRQLDKLSRAAPIPVDKRAAGNAIMGNGRRSKIGVSHSFKRTNALISLRKETMPKLRALHVPRSQGLAVSGLWLDFLSTVFRRFRRFWRAATGEGIASFQRLACGTVF